MHGGIYVSHMLVAESPERQILNVGTMRTEIHPVGVMI